MVGLFVFFGRDWFSTLGPWPRGSPQVGWLIQVEDGTFGDYHAFYFMEFDAVSWAKMDLKKKSYLARNLGKTHWFWEFGGGGTGFFGKGRLTSHFFCLNWFFGGKWKWKRLKTTCIIWVFPKIGVPQNGWSL